MQPYIAHVLDTQKRIVGSINEWLKFSTSHGNIHLEDWTIIHCKLTLA